MKRTAALILLAAALVFAAPAAAHPRHHWHHRPWLSQRRAIRAITNGTPTDYTVRHCGRGNRTAVWCSIEWEGGLEGPEPGAHIASWGGFWARLCNHRVYVVENGPYSTPTCRAARLAQAPEVVLLRR